MTRATLVEALGQHGVEASPELLDTLSRAFEAMVDQAWLSNEQALELASHLNGRASLYQWLAKHQVRRQAYVSRTSDVLRAVARGDRRRRREESR